MPGKSRRGGALRSVARLVVVVLQASSLYIRVRVMLWKWRIVQKRRFRRSIRGLPRGLALDLERAYEEKIRVFRLPGLREIVSSTRRGSGRGE